MSADIQRPAIIRSDPGSQTAPLLLMSAPASQVLNLVFLSPPSFAIQNVDCRDLEVRGCVFLNAADMLSDWSLVSQESRIEELNYENTFSIVDQYRAWRLPDDWVKAGYLLHALWAVIMTLYLALAGNCADTWLSAVVMAWFLDFYGLQVLECIFLATMTTVIP